MDACQSELSTLRSFVLPGGTRLNAELHVCRTVCRRAERCAVALARVAEVDPLAVAYLNRLSDAFFVWSRYATVLAGTPEWLWDPNRAASARA
ncbi:MAG: ATP:cob(I)alamin adenosyltransferase [Polyangiaceae bacterium]